MNQSELIRKVGSSMSEPVDGDLYYEVMDRILVEYGFDGQEWGTSIDLKGETDPLTADMIPGIWNLTWKEKTWLRRIRKTCFQVHGRQLP